MADLRKQLSEAKQDIEKRAGYKFNREYVALADLISEFVAIKVGGQVGDIAAIKEELKPSVHSIGQAVGKPSDDSLYEVP
jgi:hypothetical protein